ncbi:MAG: hypothetical protein WCT03_07595, partial [Candidatus Obscuribacterales bacterium]
MNFPLCSRMNYERIYERITAYAAKERLSGNNSLIAKQRGKFMVKELSKKEPKVEKTFETLSGIPL